MKNYSFHILRVGLAITFIWIGILILKEPLAWGGMIQPWALEFMFMPLEQAMIATAILDIAVGIFLLLGVWIWVASLLGFLHLAIVLATVGIDAITVRDIGLIAGLVALMFSSWPESFKLKNNKEEIGSHY